MLTDFIKFPFVKLIDNIIPKIKAQIGIKFHANSEIKGVKKRIACKPNLDESTTKEDRSEPSMRDSQVGRLSGRRVTIKKRLVINSEASLGVRFVILGPSDRLENHIGVDRYNNVIKNAVFWSRLIHKARK